MDFTRASPDPRVCVAPEMCVASDHAGQVSTAIVVVLDRRRDRAPWAEELVVQRQMGPLKWPGFRAEHMLPPSIREEAVVAACDQSGAVFKR